VVFGIDAERLRVFRGEWAEQRDADPLRVGRFPRTLPGSALCSSETWQANAETSSKQPQMVLLFTRAKVW